MSLSYQNPDPSNKPVLQRPLRWRLIAILIMVVGAIGFGAGLLLFDQQISCLALSTLITLGGLALNITARRKGWTTVSVQNGISETRSASAARWLRRSNAPKGLRSTTRAAAPVQTPMTAQPAPGRRSVSVRRKEGSLLDRVIAILEAQGASVSIESEREDRGILRVATQQGQQYIAMVLEGATPVDINEVRSLQALISGSRSTRGYLIAGGGISERAYQWAEGRPQIRLVAEDELSELGI